MTVALTFKALRDPVRLEMIKRLASYMTHTVGSPVAWPGDNSPGRLSTKPKPSSPSWDKRLKALQEFVEEA